MKALFAMTMKLTLLGCLFTSVISEGLHSMLGKTMTGDIKPLADFEGKPVPPLMLPSF